MALAQGRVLITIRGTSMYSMYTYTTFHRFDIAQQ